MNDHASAHAGSRRLLPGPAAHARQERIVAAALDVLCDAGIAGVSTRKVAARAEMNLGSLHYAFGSKDEILFAALQAITHEVRQTLFAAVADATDLATALECAHDAYWSLVQATPALQRVQYELTTYALSHPHAGDLAVEQYGGYLGAIEQAIEGVIGVSGEALAVPVPQLARQALAGFDGVILQYLVDGDAEAAQATLQAQRRSLLCIALPKGRTP